MIVYHFNIGDNMHIDKYKIFSMDYTWKKNPKKSKDTTVNTNAYIR